MKLKFLHALIFLIFLISNKSFGNNVNIFTIAANDPSPLNFTIRPVDNDDNFKPRQKISDYRSYNDDEIPYIPYQKENYLEEREINYAQHESAQQSLIQQNQILVSAKKYEETYEQEILRQQKQETELEDNSISNNAINNLYDSIESYKHQIENGLFDSNPYDNSSGSKGTGKDNNFYNKSYILKNSSKNLLNELSLDSNKFETFYGNPIQQNIHGALVQIINTTSIFNEKFKTQEFTESIIHLIDCAYKLNRDYLPEYAIKLYDICKHFIAFAQGVANAFKDNVTKVKEILKNPIDFLIDLNLSLGCLATNAVCSLANFILNPQTDDVYRAQFGAKYDKFVKKYSDKIDRCKKMSSEQIIEKIGYKITNFTLDTIVLGGIRGTILSAQVKATRKAFKSLSKSRFGKYSAKIVGNAYKKGINNVKSGLNTILKDQDIVKEVLTENSLKHPDFFNKVIDKGIQCDKNRNRYALEIIKNSQRIKNDKLFAEQIKKFGLNKHFVPGEKGIVVDVLPNGFKMAVDKFGRVWRKYPDCYNINDWIIESSEASRIATGSLIAKLDKSEKSFSFGSNELENVFSKKVGLPSELEKELKNIQKVAENISNKTKLNNTPKTIDNIQPATLTKNTILKSQITNKLNTSKQPTKINTKINELNKNLQYESLITKDLKNFRKIDEIKQYLSSEQSKNLKRFLDKLPANSKSSVKVKLIENGGKIFIADSPANNIPGSFSRYEKTVSSTGKTIAYFKTTYAPNGTIVHIKNKLKN